MSTLNKLLTFSSLASLAVINLHMESTDACSNIIVSPGASTDSSAIMAYNADSSTLYGSLYHYPAANHPAGSLRNIYDWDSGKYLGAIPEAEHTYNVVGNMNEFGLSIGETTYGGIGALQEQDGAIMDYGSLIWVTLQRAKTAREAIQVAASLMEQFGYASEGESFSIIDNHEAWVMEIIGKGNFEKGAVWVARKIPEGYVCAHANQARITTFPLDRPDETLYSRDVISFAKQIGLYPKDAKDSDFSFSDVYDPVTFSGARFCDARVWSFFGAIMGQQWADQYLDYAMGANLTNRMPLWVSPSAKISASDVMGHMRNHYENTKLSMDGKNFPDVGASFDQVPVRAHPLTWLSSTGTEYLNERPIATQQTGWNFVAQSRKWMPAELSGLLWFGVDDSSTTVRFPEYGSATRVALSFAGQGAQDGVTPPVMSFDDEKANDVFNLVANWAYSRWDLMYPEILANIQSIENTYKEEVNRVDMDASTLYTTQGAAVAVEYVTQYSEKTGNDLVKTWRKYFGQLFVKYRDGYVITESAENTACGCSSKSGPYPQQWYDRIATETGEHYKVLPDSATAAGVRDSRWRGVSKTELLKRK